MNQQGPGFSGPMGAPMGGMSSQMQINQGYNQGMGQSGYIQQGQMQQQYGQQMGGMGGMQGQGNPYELQAGQRGGYSTQYQQQNNQYRADQDLPKRW
jgi:hypothetical protein